MNFREATIQDITQMQLVRNSVKENVLSNPALVSEADYMEYLSSRGRGWVCEVNGYIAGFSVADLVDNNIWALFVHPEHEGHGIGCKLHELMLDWYFGQGKEMVWLSTAPGTRAEAFYKKAGWTNEGPYGTNEIKLVMKRDEWAVIRGS